MEKRLEAKGRSGGRPCHGNACEDSHLRLHGNLKEKAPLKSSSEALGLRSWELGLRDFLVLGKLFQDPYAILSLGCRSKAAHRGKEESECRL